MIGVALALCVAFPGIAEEEYVYPVSPERIGSETAAEKAERLAWWTHDRFGMFIHFGLYAIPARGEWVRYHERITNERYDADYFSRFNPDLFDAGVWAKTAKAAGMKYVVLTAKHHDGFCLWDTKTTDYKITGTPFGRDLVREFVEACRAEGLRVGLYFSVIDWHHPDFTIDQVHPLRPKEGFTEENYAALNQGRDMARYRACMFAQVRELLGGDYGKIDILWFDYTEKGRWGKTWKDWDAVELLKLARRLQRGVIIDNRLGLDATADGGDFVTPEQYKVSQWPRRNGERFAWETCQTFSGAWGYNRDELTWKSPAQLIELLAHTVSFGGNLILNVGPTARGTFDRRATARLKAIGEWMQFNSRAVYGCTEAPPEFNAPNGTLLTYNPVTKRLYVFLTTYPLKALSVDFDERIAFAQFLHDGSELKIVSACESRNQGGEMRMPGAIAVPVVKPDVEIPVIEITLKD
jgi:alpha-L-fucosidase